MIITSALIGSAVSAQTLLDGDERLSCEAILCLSSGERPSECTPSLNRFFSISARDAWKKIEKRRDFLNICPAAHEPNMPALVSAIAAGAGQCDAEFLNRNHTRLVTWYETVWVGGDAETERKKRTRVEILSNKPSYCAIYEGHAYTNLYNTIYIGTPENGGFWSDSENYEADLQKYNATQANNKNQNNLWNRNRNY